MIATLRRSPADNASIPLPSQTRNNAGSFRWANMRESPPDLIARDWLYDLAQAAPRGGAFQDERRGSAGIGGWLPEWQTTPAATRGWSVQVRGDQNEPEESQAKNR